MAKPNAAQLTVVIDSPVLHDGDLLSIGDELALPKPVAEQLIAVLSAHDPAATAAAEPANPVG